ncbi:MAG: FAD binding domain-containing protein [Pseudomonadota bacterium]
MLPAKIEQYIRPSSPSEAIAAMQAAEEGEAIFLAGGQSVMQAIKARMMQPSCIIDLQDLADLKGIDANDGLTIGAMTRYVEIAEADNVPAAFGALQDAAQHVGDRQVRNRGTIGGSCCWNYVASCMPAVCLGLGATMKLIDAQGATRDVPAEEFFIAPLETARDEFEILMSLHWPTVEHDTGSAYKKWGLVKDALPVVGVCISLAVDSLGTCISASVSLSGLEDGAQLAPAASEALVGQVVDEKSILAAMNAAADAASVQGDAAADTEYRKQLIRTLGVDVGLLALARAQGQGER